MITELDRLNFLLGDWQINPILWQIHFPNSVVINDVENPPITAIKIPTCGECEDFKQGLCVGINDPITCFLGESKQSPINFKSNVEKSVEMLILNSKNHNRKHKRRLIKKLRRYK